MEIAQEYCTQNYVQTFTTLRQKLTRMADSFSTIPALGGTTINPREKPGTTLKKAKRSSLLFLGFLFEVQSNNLQQDTDMLSVSDFSVYTWG